jgi:hypothetical protein
MEPILWIIGSAFLVLSAWFLVFVIKDLRRNGRL